MDGSKTSEVFAKWLKQQHEYQVRWASVIAARTALRVIPFAVGDDIVRDRAGSLTLGAFRCCSTSWAAINYPAFGMKAANAEAFKSRDFQGAANNAGEPLYSAAYVISRANYAAFTDKIDSVYHAVDAVDRSTDADYAAFADALAHTAFRATLDADCSWLASEGERHKAARRITARKLWPIDEPTGWRNQWELAKAKLLGLDTQGTYQFWIDWYERRIRGERAAFDIPGDKGRIEDKKILRRLAEATDEDFWGKGHEYVNATLKGWLDEARARAAPPPIVGGALGAFEISGSATGTLGTINPDSQDARSPQFGLDPMGHIAIKADAGTDQLRSDPQSLSRHARALQMARILGKALRNHNNAGYITEMVNDYIAPMGYGPDGADPSGLVFAGDQLREAITKHRGAGPNDDLQPLPPSADRHASAFLAAHNMYVGSDPFLDDLDRTTRGPDAPLPSANPDEIMGVVTAARQADIVAEPTYDYMVAASNAAPPTYDQYDRHSRFAAGLAQNFARYGVEFLWAYPTEAAWVGVAATAGATVMLGPIAVAGGAIAGVTIAYKLARNMVANEATYRKLLATSPAGEDNFNRLMRFVKSLPIKSLKDD